MLSGERKSITVLACALWRADDLANRLSLDAWYGLTQRFLALARHVTQRYEGVIQHVGNGDFLACFGVPITHEDHAYRAVLAAFDVQRYLRQHSDAFRDGEAEAAAAIGLHSGQVIVGPVGDDSTQMPLPVGNVVQIAEALRRLAPPDAILLSAATRQVLKDAPRLEMAPWSPDAAAPLPVEAYLARETQTAAPGRQRQRKLSPFVGREREMMALQALYADAARGYGQVVGVMGEPGMGKTRLLHEFRDDIERGDQQYLVGHCHAYGQATPYLPLRDLLCHACAIGEADSAPHTRALERAQAHQERGHEAYALKLLGDIASHPLLRTPDLGEAMYRQALSLTDSLGMRPLAAHCHAGLGSLFSETGDRRQARLHHQAAADSYLALGMAYWLPQA